jgi:predicted ATP-dependent endonuclease of OLD family
MRVIKKVKLHNFKRFQDIEIPFDEQLNILIGDNESGKSSVLLALDLVIGGSRSKVETLGLQSLFNTDAVATFLAGKRTIENLPTLFVEVYLNEQNDFDLNGKNHSDDSRRACDGLRLSCEPVHDLSKEILEILGQEKANFPFEYYTVKFQTFADQPYTGYRKFLRHLMLDSSQINNEYATQSYIKAVYGANVEDSEKFKNQNEYRRHKSEFTDSVLKSVNSNLDDYSFSIRTSSKSNLETDLTIMEDTIPIENKGKGRQCFIKTEFALQKGKSGQDLDALLLEEPENHLSHVNMKKLIQQIAKATTKQLFIATHNNLISTRLDLRKSIMFNSNSCTSTLLSDLPADTAKFFMKAPDNNILEFILSRKVLLVEGDAEYILLEAFNRNATGESLESSEFHVISVGGTSFKRYLDLAKLLGIKTAVIRDNDEDPQRYCIENYKDYKLKNVEIFYDDDPKEHTFEICLYNQNKDICDALFSEGRKTLSVLDYMLGNKTEVAFQLLDKKADELVAPGYIKKAIEWIRK